MRNRSSTGLCARETHRARRTRALSRVPRERGKEELGKGKVAAQFERSGAHLVGQVRLLNVALVLGHRGGCGVGVGVGDVGLGVCVQPVPRESGRPRRNAAVSYSTAARFKQSGVVAEICSIPRRTAVCTPRNRAQCVRKTTLTSVLLCANGTDIHVGSRYQEEPGRLRRTRTTYFPRSTSPCPVRRARSPSGPCPRTVSSTERRLPVASSTSGYTSEMFQNELM